MGWIESAFQSGRSRAIVKKEEFQTTKARRKAFEAEEVNPEELTRFLMPFVETLDPLFDGMRKHGCEISGPETGYIDLKVTDELSSFDESRKRYSLFKVSTESLNPGERDFGRTCFQVFGVRAVVKFPDLERTCSIYVLPLNSPETHYGAVEYQAAGSTSIPIRPDKINKYKRLIVDNLSNFLCEWVKKESYEQELARPS